MNLLLIEDEKITRITLRDALKKAGHSTVACESAEEGLRHLEAGSFDVVVSDIRLPGKDGLEVFAEVKKHHLSTEVILMTAYASVETAVDALRRGAHDYLVKPFLPDELVNRLSHLETLRRIAGENRELRRQLTSLRKPMITGRSQARKQLAETLEMVADRDTSVLLEGETGTGKEVVARVLHDLSSRSEHAFVPVNCAAIPDTLLESSLFGHEKGAFSGAERRHLGYFERADKGTLFLDDIDDLPQEAQVKLLRVLQERTFERVGGSQPITIDIRLICATKASLWDMVQQKTFRDDLYFRLNIVPIRLPPLRETYEDIPDFVENFLDRNEAGVESRKRALDLLPNLMTHDWPGNIRELQAVVDRIIALPERNDPEFFLGRPSVDTHQPPDRASGGNYPPYEQFIEQKDREIITWALESADRNVAQAATLLGIPRSTLRSKIEKYGLEG
ncbi:MAG: sigma-54 dependent transcriptional regulator [Acidobacteriota bacterium]